MYYGIFQRNKARYVAILFALMFRALLEKKTTITKSANFSITEEVPYINVPLHSLLVVRSIGYEFTIETVPLQVECVDTYRIRPKVS